jgi:hypothetical protein
MPDYSRLHRDFDRRLNQLEKEQGELDKYLLAQQRKDREHDMRLKKSKFFIFLFLCFSGR